MKAGDVQSLTVRAGGIRTSRPHRAPLAVVLVALLVLCGLVVPAGVSAA